MHKCSSPIKETFRGEELTIHGIDHYVCKECGEIIFDAENGQLFDQKLTSQYASLMGLLTPTEIRKIRKRFGLNQQDFERVLGVSTPSVSRWETGKVPQSKPVDLLMRAYNQIPQLMEDRMKQIEVAPLRV